MIWNSSPWKTDIWKCSRYFEKLSLQSRRLSDAQCISVEKQAFLAFYSIRKLLEAKKLSDGCASQGVQIVEYKRTASIITHLNWHHADRHFDLQCPKNRNWSVVQLCNQFVHSYIFHALSSVDSGLGGLWVASDKQKNTSLLEIRTAQIVNLLDSIAEDDVVASRCARDLKNGKETFRLSSQLLGDEKKFKI